MKKNTFTALALIGLMPLLSHCASQDDVQALNYHVRSINKKLDDMKNNTVGQMQQRQAMSSGQLDQLQADILQLKSKLEENSHMARMLQEQNKELQLALQTLASEQEARLNLKLSELETRIATQKETLTALQMARVQDAERRSKAARRAAEEAMRKAQRVTLSNSSSRSGAVPHIRAQSRKRLITASSGTNSSRIRVQPVRTSTRTASSTGSTPTTPATVTVDNYGLAMQSYRDGKFKKAYSLFEKDVNKRGRNKNAILSRYMMGESLLKLKEYDQAIIQYQQIISNYPGTPNAAKALLRQGQAFEDLSDKETARIIYKKLLASYGSSPEASQAKKRIAEL
jgi:TolA-binding protein